MRSIAIVGAGHAGLQLGIGLIKQGYDVTIVTDRTGEDVACGNVLSSQGMQRTALEHERNLGLAFWDETAPKHDFVEFSMSGGDCDLAVNWRAPLPLPGNSVCQRVKIPRWMTEFEALGGTLMIEPANLDKLERLVLSHELVVVATGKGEIGRIFERDARRSPYDKPMRALALTYCVGMKPTQPNRGITFNVAPEIGEYFVMPALTSTADDCEIMVFEGLPNGPMDCWRDVSTPAEHLRRSKEILERFFPWEAERCAQVELTDARGILSGRFPPTVRKPVADLPSGGIVLGIGDVVMLNDPLTGQGSNNASKLSWHYLNCIVARENRPFDRDWMEDTFESYWAERGRLTTDWSNRMLLPPSPHTQAILHAAETNPNIAENFAACFDNPPDFFPWLFEPDAAEAMFGPIKLHAA